MKFEVVPESSARLTGVIAVAGSSTSGLSAAMAGFNHWRQKTLLEPYYDAYAATVEMTGGCVPGSKVTITGTVETTQMISYMWRIRDTLQAVSRHQFAPLLADPGEQDLTSHVDFEATARAAREWGAAVTEIVPQGRWLDRLGIAARARALAAASPESASDIAAAQERLCDPSQMGVLFKAIAIHSPDWPRPAGFEA